MAKGERSVFVLRASEMRPAAVEAAAAGGGRACLLPEPPVKAAQVELELELVGLVQVWRVCIQLWVWNQCGYGFIAGVNLMGSPSHQAPTPPLMPPATRGIISPVI